MRTVRQKLVALVLLCTAPAVVGALYRSREAEADLLRQVERRVDRVNTRFAEELEEYQTNANVALALTESSTRFQQGLATRDPTRVERAVTRLSDVYKNRVILAADQNGVVLAAGNAPRGPKSLATDSSPQFSELLSGKPLVGIIEVTFNDGLGYALVSAHPVHDLEKRVGSIAMLTPITATYLGYLEPKLNSDLALRVNGKLVASSPNHPAKDLVATGTSAVLKEVGPRLFAMKTFAPPSLQRPDLRLEITASRDVTELRDGVRKALYWQLAVLSLGLAVVLVLALRFASRLGKSVSAMSDAADQIKLGKYVTVTPPDTDDEIEALGEHFNQMVQGLRERDRLRETFGRYVTRQVAEHLMKGNVNLGGELVPVTVLFSDIRHFTSISERMEPRVLLDFLNEYFSGMVESVMLHHGVVDKFIGDAIMAVFGAPVPEADDALNAVRAAVAMQQRLRKINVAFKSKGLPEIRTGIGLHSGQVVAGNIGHVERMEYTVIGDTVNLASRLEGMTKDLDSDIVMSEDLYKQVENDVEAEPLKRITVKGRNRDVMVYRLIGLKGQAAAVEVGS